MKNDATAAAAPTPFPASQDRKVTETQPRQARRFASGPVGTLEIHATVACRYRVVRPLGRGGMGTLYEVIDTHTDRLRALKVFSRDSALDPEVAQRFRREATIAGRVESEHVVEVVDAGVMQPHGVPFLVMELLRGEDLDSLLAREGPLPPDRVVELLAQAALGLDKLRDESIAHRDLKPANLFLTRRDDGSDLLKIVDFGVAKAVDRDTTLRTTRNFGTPLFMSPEQMRGDPTVDWRADLYALAHISFTMLAGFPYWKEELQASSTDYPLLLRATRGLPEAASVRAARHGVCLPASFDAWFRRGTAVDPSHRFESASEQVRSLADVLGVPLPHSLRDGPMDAGSSTARTGLGVPPTLPSQPAPPEAMPPRSRSSWKNRRAFVPFFIAVVVLVTGITVSLLAEQPSPHAGTQAPSPTSPASRAGDTVDAAPSSTPFQSSAATARPPPSPGHSSSLGQSARPSPPVSGASHPASTRPERTPSPAQQHTPVAVPSRSVSPPAGSLWYAPSSHDPLDDM